MTNRYCVWILSPLLLMACGERGTPVPPSESVPPPPAAAPADPENGVAVEPDAACNAEQAEWAVGQIADEDLLARARDAAGARTARFLRPDEAITLEYLGSRLNLELDEYETVISVRCG